MTRVALEQAEDNFIVHQTKDAAELRLAGTVSLWIRPRVFWAMNWYNFIVHDTRSFFEHRIFKTISLCIKWKLSDLLSSESFHLCAIFDNETKVCHSTSLPVLISSSLEMTFKYADMSRIISQFSDHNITTHFNNIPQQLTPITWIHSKFSALNVVVPQLRR